MTEDNDGLFPAGLWPGGSDPVGRRLLCAHANEDGQGMHWLEPGETCDRPRAADLLESDGLRQVRAYLDQVGGQDPGQ